MTHMSPEVIAALTTAAVAVGLEPALLLALVEVETRGVPFASDGILTILCEPATFYSELAPRNDLPPSLPLHGPVALLLLTRRAPGL